MNYHLILSIFVVWNVIGFCLHTTLCFATKTAHFEAFKRYNFFIGGLLYLSCLSNYPLAVVFYMVVFGFHQKMMINALSDALDIYRDIRWKSAD